MTFRFRCMIRLMIIVINDYRSASFTSTYQQNAIIKLEELEC